MRDARLRISILILVVIGLHALPVVSYQGVGQTRWPFLAWAMYARSIPPGPVQTSKRGLVGTTVAGREEPVTAAVAGLSKPAFRNIYLNPLYAGDSTTARELFDRVNRERDDPFVALRTEGQRLTLTDSGVVTERFPVITYSAPPARTE